MTDHPSIAEFGTELEVAMTTAAVRIIRSALEDGRRPENFKSSMVIAAYGALSSVIAATANPAEKASLVKFVHERGNAMFDQFLEAKAVTMTQIKRGAAQ